MRVVFVGLLILVFAGSTAVVRADDLPEPFKPLAGAWVRHLSRDGDVIPELMFVADPPEQPRPAEVRKILRKLGKEDVYLVVAVRPAIGSFAFGRDSSTYAVKAAKTKDVLVLTVGEKEVPLKYKLDKNTLTIVCKEPVAAGIRRERSDISGTWVRAK